MTSSHIESTLHPPEPRVVAEPPAALLQAMADQAEDLPRQRVLLLLLQVLGAGDEGEA